jgi:hypothetical protein
MSSPRDDTVCTSFHSHSRPYKPPPNTDIKELSCSTLVRCAEYGHSCGGNRGTAQYNMDETGGGDSGTGLAALNFARITFSIEQCGLKNAALIPVLARECAEVHCGLATFI